LSYYIEKIVEEYENIDNPWLILGDFTKQPVTLRDFLSNFEIKDDKSKLSILKSEIFKEIGFFEESMIEIKIALKNNPGNIALLFELCDIYARNKNYYQSLYFTEIIFNYIAENQDWNEVPLELWLYLYPDYYGDIVRECAEKYNLEPLIIYATIREESRFNSFDESVAGARGLMQIIYSTGEWIAEKINIENFSDEMLFSPRVNIDLGCWYIRYLKDRFEDNLILMISGYNAGPGITSKWLEKYDISDPDNFIEDIPYDETREHVKKVFKAYKMYERLNKLLKHQT
jgi:soluble lytic murein transglycosylase-like protein